MTLLIFKFSFYQAKEVLNCSYLKTGHKTQNNEMLFLMRTLLNSKTSFLIGFCMSLVSDLCLYSSPIYRYWCFFRKAPPCFSKSVWLLFRPLLKGEELYTQLVFFVQSIFADRYIHRRELRLVSLESLSSVKYGIKLTFLIFVFDREISRFKLSRK